MTRSLCCALLVGSGGCTGDGGESVLGRGTPACQDWQDAICDFASDECGFASRGLCDDQYQGAECLTDEKATSCANAFQEASCMAPPIDCDLSSVADPAPAIAKCERLLQAACELEIRCGGAGSIDECVQSVMTTQGVDCSSAISVDLRYEDCVERMANAACQDAVAAIAGCSATVRAF